MGRHAQEQISFKEYVKFKIKVLKQMHIGLTAEQEAHIKSLTREIDVDNYCHDLIMKG